MGLRRLMGVMAMNDEYQNARRNRSARAAVLLGLVVLLVASAQQAAAEQYYNSFSKMVSMTSTWQSSFYSGIIRANASKGSFGELAGAPRITQQDIQNLCKPFPCGNESSLNTAPSQPTPPAPTATSPTVG